MNIDNIIPEGYILLARKIRRSPLWLSLKATHRIVMIELLLQAQFQDGEVVRNGEILALKRGQIATSYQHLVDDIGDKDITVKVVRNAINKLVKHDFLAKDEAKARAKKGLLLTVNNYCIYQDSENYKGKAKGKDEGKEGAKQGQSKGKEGAINNNGNNFNNGNNDINIIFEYWNSKGITVHRSLNQKAKSHINARLKDYSIDEVIKAIDNYKTVLESDLYWWTHKYTLEKFMLPDNFVRFVDESDPFKSFIKKGGPHGSTSGSDEAKRLIEEYNIDF